MPGLDRLWAALAFLTRAPVPPGDLVKAAPLFPLVGAALGAAVGATAIALPVPPLLAATIAVALELILTGALHLDGLADSADGLAGRDRAHALAIMRDHAVGTYGAAALVLNLLAKTVALTHVDAILPVVAAYAVSRAAPLPLAAALPYARDGGGTGRLHADRLRPHAALAGLALATAIAAPTAPPTLVALALVTPAVGVLAHRRLDGVTGDVMGAAIELTATTALIAVSV